MPGPTVQELNEALSYLDRSLTILKNMAIPQTSAPQPQLQAMQILFHNKLYGFCDRVRLFVSLSDSMSELRLLAWLDTIMDIKKQMWEGGKGRALYNMVDWSRVHIATGAIIGALKGMEAYSSDMNR